MKKLQHEIDIEINKLYREQNY